MKKIKTVIVVALVIAVIAAAALWLKSRFTKDPTLKITSSGISEAGGPEE